MRLSLSSVFLFVRLPLAALSLSGVTACGEKAEETATVEDSGVDAPESSGEDCTLLEIRPDGPAAPVVGDIWNMLMYCDDALLTGASSFRSDPADTVSFDEYVATFLVAGEVTITMQVGRYRGDVTVTVGEP